MYISVRVIPRSGKNSLEWEQGTIKARLTAPPVDGAANAALIDLLAQSLAVPKRSIQIVRGETGRQKTLEIEGVTLDEIQERIKNPLKKKKR
ncbi:hypothetical protein EI42_01016 [Thermosporothrix hazakensis]|jgi:uncharacterized protein (TIGR00251 family)|uniref:UPF0235 protein EI42_01016 n=2 Tax=Thermosporothrix TaxID=768650 RepID=A0A326UJM1_THEHA|nr:DUF167 domain-containing protein [Thermosporothrix hazakensis]PZW36830.1 hypothetical protein EI42_01016 [Thermosporothrix hazakensis]BBH89296.1 UPF0235 protein [Thermosporothrix sp. COM3]GCE47479.1 UPF0235 protein [Thermosporothrix hazakensis]